jgi:hypothetical protein
MAKNKGTKKQKIDFGNGNSSTITFTAPSNITFHYIEDNELRNLMAKNTTKSKSFNIAIGFFGTFIGYLPYVFGIVKEIASGILPNILDLVGLGVALIILTISIITFYFSSIYKDDVQKIVTAIKERTIKHPTPSIEPHQK